MKKKNTVVKLEEQLSSGRELVEEPALDSPAQTPSPGSAECQRCGTYRSMVEACLEFLETEMGWEYFREEMLYFDDAEKAKASAENARKLKNFLVRSRETLARLPGANL